MNAKTLDFQITAIDRALIGLVEERARLLSEASALPHRAPDLTDIEDVSSNVLKRPHLVAVFEAIHNATSHDSSNLTQDQAAQAGAIR